MLFKVAVGERLGREFRCILMSHKPMAFAQFVRLARNFRVIELFAHAAVFL